MFIFRLQSVLEVREKLARLRQKEFSDVLAIRQGMEGQIEQHRGDLSHAVQYIDAIKRTSPTAYPMELFGHYRERIEGEIALISEQMREQDQELESKRSSLVEAKRAQRTLEILREKERIRYDREQSRRERVTMDEVASNYYVLRHR